MTNKAIQNTILWYVAVSSAVVAMYWVRLSGPSDLERYAQDRNIGYVMDAAWRGHWVVQHDIQNRIMSKPPLHTWLAAGLSKIWGVNRVTLTLPSFLAVWAMAMLVLAVGRSTFGSEAGGFAALGVALAPMSAKQVAIVRTDPLFALGVTLTALAAWRAWNGALAGGPDATTDVLSSDRRFARMMSRHAHSWLPFWMAAAVTTLIKGPLGIVLGAAGLLAILRERRMVSTVQAPHGSHLAGVAVYLALCLGWLLPALHAGGYELIDRIIFQELFGQATGLHKQTFPGRNLPRPTLYLLWNFLPFSVFAFVGLWRVVRRPSESAVLRRFERFLFCWVAAGLVIFSLAAHHRADLLLPLWPPAALLAGREIARMKEWIGRRSLTWIAVAVSVVLLALVYWTYHHMPIRRASAVRYSAEVRRAAEAIRAAGIDPEELVHIGTPVTLQMYLHTCKSWANMAEVQDQLSRGRTVLLAVGQKERQKDFLDALGHAHIEPVCVWPQGVSYKGDFCLAILRVSPGSS